MDFNPGGVGQKGSLFGFPYLLEKADLVIIPVPWEVTASFGKGTANGPNAVLDASSQLDFMIPGLRQPWNFKSVLAEFPDELEKLAAELRVLAEKVIDELESGNSPKLKHLEIINEGSEKLNKWLYNYSNKFLRREIPCAVLGGDHSTPFGLIKSLAERESFGILQIDAHMDLRKAYEGFDHSHASIMHNVLELGVDSLIQVGIRDYSEEEEKIAKKSGRVRAYYDLEICTRIFAGENWNSICTKIVDRLPDKVYISFDIDGLDPSLCPGTGTPVPGGLTINQAFHLIEKVARSGKKIIGFDLSEVGGGGWDANVGARVLYRLCSYLGASNGRIEFE